jgi:kinetochore protein Nuf2
MSGYLPSDYSTTPTSASNAAGTPHTQFIFPLLKNAEILQCMTELGIEMISKTELAEPHRHKEKVRKIFWQLLDTCCGISEEDLAKQAPSNKDMKYPELHEDNTTDILFFKALRTLLHTCGLYDFSWKDLHFPTTKRFRCQLSAIINMAKFREEQLKVYAELNEPRAQLLLSLEDINSENFQLMEQLDNVQAESHSRLDEMDQVIQECQELEGEIARNNKLQAAKREEAALLKREANDLKDELASATWALQEAQAEDERLMAQVVSSPNRCKNELALRRERLDKEKEETRDLQEELQQNKTRMVQIQQAIKNVKEAIVIQYQVQEEATNYERAMGQVHVAIKDIDQNRENAQQIVNETEEAERGWRRTEDKIAHMRKQGKMKMQAAQDASDTAREQLLAVEKERREGMAQIEAGEAEVKTLEAQMQAEKVKTEQEIATLIADYKETEKAFLVLNEKRLHTIGVV